MESSSNVFRFQGSNMIVCAKGPNIDKNINTSTSFRSNLLSSTRNMPRNFEKHSYTESVVSQRSIYGRESSPTASIRSDLPRNFHQPFYQRGFSQRSVYNGRGGSPVSMRSIDSSVSIATDIVEAISSGKFNKYECKMINQALNNRRKLDFWKRAEKRRKMQMYLKKIRNKSEDDSGEPWSTSSSSGDDCASRRTGYSRRYDKHYKENVPQHNNIYCQSEEIFRNDDRDAYAGYTRTDPQNPYQRNTDSYPANILPYQREPQVTSNMYLSQKTGMPNKSKLHSQNNLTKAPKHTLSSQMNKTSQENMFSTQRNTLNSSICSTKSMQNMTMSQKDRFKSGFQFPSQKFNKSSVLHEEQEKIRAQQVSIKECANSRRNILAKRFEEDSDENNDIFLDTTEKPKPVTKKNNNSRQKRKVESLDELPTSAKKKPKMTTNNNGKMTSEAQKKNNNVSNDFEFAKPVLPVKKSAPAKQQEKMISKSRNAPEIVFDAEEKESILQPVEIASLEREEEPEHGDQSENLQMTTSDMSMRPSFMKRKLFTQTLDVTKRKNNSSDSLGTDSPQSNIYSALSREKHKTRKLVTSQSLLQRDVQDDNNLLDLIHKIVPPSQVNCTTNMTKSFNARTSESKAGDVDDKWDITSIISTCNNDSVSETYTDDEIFKVANDDKNKKLQEKPATKQTNPGQNKAVSAKLEGKKTSDTAKPESKKSNDTKQTNPITNKAVSAKPDAKKIIDTAKPESKKNDTGGKLENKKTNFTIAEPENKKTNDNMNKISRVVLNKIALPDTPVKALPVKKVVSSSRIDAFWNTDVESDYECAATPRARRPPNLLHLQNHPTNDIASPKQNSVESLQTKLSTKMTKTKPHELSPVVLLKETPLVKVLKKQASKALKESEPESLKKSNDDSTPPRKRGRPKKGTPTIKLQAKKQINLSTSSETVKNSQKRKGPSPNKTAPINSTTQKKRKNERKTAQEKYNMMESSSGIPKQPNKRQINMEQVKTSKKPEDTPRSQRRAKKNYTVQKNVQQENDVTCKMLRSRAVDLTSSFNSDKFELTMSRTRKSRTPSKRISFNRAKNDLLGNKTRGRATKA